MEQIWTPWRMEWILQKKPPGCLFCRIASEGDRDRANYVLFRGSHNYIVLNLYPYNNGHLMVTPYAHAGQLEELDDATLGEMIRLTRRSVGALQHALRPAGFNIGLNLGKAAGAGVQGHLHIHVVPRWEGDSSFMDVLAKTHLIPETLEQTYERLIAAGIADP